MTATMTHTLSPDQKLAADAISDWLTKPNQQLSIGGLAGTGKSFLLSHLWPLLAESGTAVCSPTGKAAQVLQQKGLPATTIHKLIYKFKGVAEYDDGTEEPIFHDEGDWGTVDGKRPMRIAVDESSMVNESVYSDLVARRLPLLWIGDHGQLAPIGGDPGIMRNPDVKLESIHRQGAGSPIVERAHDVRNGALPEKSWSDGGELKVGRIDNNDKLVQYAISNKIDQVIVPTNALRHRLNRRFRKHLGFTDNSIVEREERIICLQNDYRYNVFNGQIFRVDRVVPKRSEDDTFTSVMLSEERIDGWRENPSFMFPLQDDCFANSSFRSSDRDDTLLQFDYGYAITAHKAQGSEWNRVLVVFQDMPSFDMRRWLYTAMTRARTHLSIVIR